MIAESVYDLPGWCTKEKTERLFKLVIDNKPNLTVEIGIFGGRSFIPLGLGHKENKKGLIVGIDPYSPLSSVSNYDVNDPNYRWWNNVNHEDIYKIFLNALNKYDLEAYSKIYRNKSNEVINTFEDESIDILHQDGNHTVNVSSEEVELYHNKVKKGGYWIMDDTNWVTTKNAQRLIVEKGYELYEDYDSWKIYKRIK